MRVQMLVRSTRCTLTTTTTTTAMITGDDENDVPSSRRHQILRKLSQNGLGWLEATTTWACGGKEGNNNILYARFARSFFDLPVGATWPIRRTTTTTMMMIIMMVMMRKPWFSRQAEGKLHLGYAWRIDTTNQPATANH